MDRNGHKEILKKGKSIGPLRPLFSGSIIQIFAPFLVMILLLLPGCENTDFQTATDAGVDALKAMTLSDQDVVNLARESARYLDERHQTAPPENKHARRLAGLVQKEWREGETVFNFKVYLAPEVNAFALADGTIRIYSGLMDLLTDGELHFVIGHEIGHVVKQHMRKRIRLAYAASAVRKGIASQRTLAGDVAASLIGSLADSLLQAQFSQMEEKEADDYGLVFLKRRKNDSKDAVSALKKLASLGKDHSFLSSHPDPEKRAARIQAQREGKALSIEEQKEDFLQTLKAFLGKWLSFFGGGKS
ncbi:MAG: M48 family metalloprotease [Thermodesulfobacteriota bacterium]